MSSDAAPAAGWERRLAETGLVWFRYRLRHPVLAVVFLVVVSPLIVLDLLIGAQVVGVLAGLFLLWMWLSTLRAILTRPDALAVTVERVTVYPVTETPVACSAIHRVERRNVRVGRRTVEAVSFDLSGDDFGAIHSADRVT